MQNHESFFKKLILITGKGGVGKTTMAQSIAQELAEKGRKTLLCHVLALDDEKVFSKASPSQRYAEIVLNYDECFREYVGLKLKLRALTTFFLNNKITRYLEKAAPGVKEIVLLGKVWFERQNYDHVVVDMPSSGYALTMLQVPFNFKELFPGGPIYKDCHEMIQTFGDPQQTTLAVATLLEEMPVQETLETNRYLTKLFAQNPTKLLANRVLEPNQMVLNKIAHYLQQSPPSNSKTKVLEYVNKKYLIQAQQLKTLEELWPSSNRRYFYERNRTINKE